MARQAELFMNKTLTITNSIHRLKNILADNLVKKLMKTAGIVLLGSTGASILNFATFTIVVKMLGVKLLALFVLTQTYMLIFSAIFNIQTWESVVKFGCADSKERRLEDVVKVNFIMDVISALIGFCIAVLLVKPLIGFFDWDPMIINPILICSLTILFNLRTFTIGIPRLFDKFSEVARIRVYMCALKLILMLVALFTDQSLTTCVVIYMVSDVLNSALLILYSLYLLRSYGHGQWLKSKIKRDPEQFRFVWWTNLRSIMRVPVQYMDMIVISMVMPLETVGIYKVYKEISKLLGKGADPINQVIYPEYSKLIGANDTTGATSLAKRTSLILLGVSSVLSVSLIIASHFLVGTVYGPEFLPSIYALYILIGVVGVSLFTLPINALFVAAGFAKLGFYIVVFTNILYIVVAFFGGKLLGVYGVVLAFALQMLFNQGLKVFFLKKYRRGWSNTIR